MDIQAIKQKIKELQQVVDDTDKLPEAKDLDLSVGQEIHYVHRFADNRMSPYISSFRITGLPFLPISCLKKDINTEMSLLDANIIPNTYNNHICFNKLEDAEKCVRLWNAGQRN